MCCPVAKHMSGRWQKSCWWGFLWGQKQKRWDLVTWPFSKMNFTSRFQKWNFILRWSSFLHQWASVTGWKQEAVKRLDQSLKSQVGKFIFANSLVMVGLVKVVTNFVVHFITLPLLLWGTYFEGSEAAKINCYTALPLSCPARCNPVVLSCPKLRLSGVAEEPRAFPEDQCRRKWSEVPFPQCLCSTCWEAPFASLCGSGGPTLTNVSWALATSVGLVKINESALIISSWLLV